MMSSDYDYRKNESRNKGKEIKGGQTNKDYGDYKANPKKKNSDVSDVKDGPDR